MDTLMNLVTYTKSHPLLWQALKLTLICIAASISYWVAKKIIIRTIKKIIIKTSTQLDDFLLNSRFLRRCNYFAPILVVRFLSFTIPEFQKVIDRMVYASLLLVLTLLLGAFLSGVTDVLMRSEKYKHHPIKSYIQIAMILVYVINSIIIIAILLGESPWSLLGGIGALTAVILLIFKDTIMSFVASIQISSYDLIKIGDWIEAPKFGTDGDVIDISLHTIKIQNWDKTISVIPTYKLIEDSFKNWRGMTLSGGRRIKRSIYIDQNSVHFCNLEMLERFKKYQLIHNYIEQKIKEIKTHNQHNQIDESQLINGRRLTNLGTLRAYIKAYLMHRQDIRKDFTFLIRQLQPGPGGIPIEIYVFTTTTNWVEYEEIQADIFDHIIAVVPSFDLLIFQNPSGQDFRHWVAI